MWGASLLELMYFAVMISRHLASSLRITSITHSLQAAAEYWSKSKEEWDLNKDLVK